MDAVPAMAEAGISVIHVHLRRFTSHPDDVLRAVEETARRFEPLRGLPA